MPERSQFIAGRAITAFRFVAECEKRLATSGPCTPAFAIASTSSAVR